MPLRQNQASSDTDTVMAAPVDPQSPSSSDPARKSAMSKPQKKAPTSFDSKTPEELKAAVAIYGRGGNINTRSVKDKKLRGNLKKLELRYKDAATKAKDSEMLLQEEGGYLEAEGMEKTYKFAQKDIVKEVDVATASKGFELKLPTFGPYSVDYNRTGRYLLLGGQKGHIAAFDWREGKLECEIQLGETVRDVKWLHNENFFAVAQKKYVYIYDSQGVEVHCLKKHIEVTHMEFLPYHFLLATIGNAGYLKYQDTSTGTLLCEHRTKLGTPTALAQNPRNAIIHVGHGNGRVTLWSPNMGDSLITMLTNRGPVRAVSVDRGGYYMATAGADSRMNIFDIRTYKEVHSYFTPTPASSLHISDTGLLGVGWGPHVTIWKDALRTKQNSPYITHLHEAVQISDVRFCPLDDVLGVGHGMGFDSLIVPGAGEANYDALEANPYETKKMRREGEVKALLEKLKPEMISLDPDFVGRIDTAKKSVKDREREEAERAKKLEQTVELEIKNKQRGKNSALRRYLRKKGGKNVIDERRLKLEALKKERNKKIKSLSGKESDELGPALSRFVRN
ncbi:putative U3 small nucleolar RNA-associated protein 7 [Rhizina undulata]